jgi:RNA polymerase sigma-70 factor (ECF subfamily)
LAADHQPQDFLVSNCAQQAEWVRALQSQPRSPANATRERALQEIIEAWGGALFQMCLRIACNRTDAEDALQETWIDLDRGIAGFRAEAQLLTWLFRIAIRHATRIRNQRQSKPALELEDGWAEGSAGDPSRTLEQLEGARRLLGAIAELPLEQRVVLGLAAGEELPHAQIAAILGVPEGTVGSRLHTARENLKARLGLAT